jgi:hypothetical protein
MKCDASVFHLAGTLKDLFAKHEISNEKMEERKHRDKEEAMKNYYDVQE